MNIRTILPAAAALILSIQPVFSADGAAPSGPAEPAETEIILPQMYLEIEDLTIEEIDAVIPDDTEVMLSSLELPLPEPDDIAIPAAAFAMGDETPPVSVAGAGGGGLQSNSFFSEGAIGVGTSAGITGDINLYHIGSQPDFRLRYYHESADGFAGKEAGQGFSSREELIEAEVDFRDEKLSADVLVTYNELEDGLQDSAGYYTATRRTPELTGGISWAISDLWKLDGELGASMSSLQLNAQNPLSFGSFNIAPGAGIIFGSDSYNVGAEVDYELNGRTGGTSIVQDLGGSLVFTVAPADIFNLRGKAGLLWSGFSDLLYPFALEITGTTAVFDYNVSGGYRASYTDRDILLDIFPAAAGPESADVFGSMPLTHGWFAEGGGRWNITERLSVNAALEFSVLRNSPEPASSALAGFNALSFSDSTCLDAGAGVYLRFTDDFSVSAAWTGQMLKDLDWYRPLHNIYGEMEYNSASGNWGITGSADFSVYSESQSWYTNDWLPEFGLEAYLRIADGFVLSIEGADLAAGLLEDGRKVWGEYLDEGASLQAKIKISL